MKFGQFMSYYKRKNFIKNFYKNCDLKTSSRPFFICKEGSMKQATYIRFVIANLSKFVQISILTSTESFLQKGLELVSRPYFLQKFLMKKYFVILLKLAKFHYQTAFTFQFIQQYMFRVSCLGIWWRHDIWVSQMFQFDYFKNQKSFRSEIKSIFSCFEIALF